MKRDCWFHVEASVTLPSFVASGAGSTILIKRVAGDR